MTLLSPLGMYNECYIVIVIFPFYVATEIVYYFKPITLEHVPCIVYFLFPKRKGHFRK